MFQYVFLLTVLSFIFVTQELTVVTYDVYSRMYGFPIPYITEGFGFSFHYDIFVLPLICNLLTNFAFWLVTVFIIKKTHFQINIHKAILRIAWAITVLLFFLKFYISIDDVTFHWFYDIDFVVKSKSLQWFAP